MPYWMIGLVRQSFAVDETFQQVSLVQQHAGQCGARRSEPRLIRLFEFDHERRSPRERVSGALKYERLGSFDVDLDDVDPIQPDALHVTVEGHHFDANRTARLVVLPT